MLMLLGILVVISLLSLPDVNRVGRKQDEEGGEKEPD